MGEVLTLTLQRHKVKKMVTTRKLKISVQCGTPQKGTEWEKRNATFKMNWGVTSVVWKKFLQINKKNIGNKFEMLDR